MKILHISDLHVRTKSSGEDGLREGFYKEYIGGFSDLVKEDLPDLLVVTGDFMDRADELAINQINSVLDFLSIELGLKRSQIFIINGNHDIHRESGYEAFKDILLGYEVDKEIIKKCDLYTLYSFNDSVVLCLNSMLGNEHDGTPCELEVSQADMLISDVQNIGVNDLFVLSHHPPKSYDLQNEMPYEESGWHPRHIWVTGGVIFDRLAHRTCVSGSVYWFSGDVHSSEYTRIKDNQFLNITGSFNFHKGGVL